MIGAAGSLLNRYPPSFAKREAARVLGDVSREQPPERALRFVVYDIVYAFQRLEAQRLSIRPDKHPIGYAEFRYNFVAALTMWVPGRDPIIDDIRRAIEANTGDQKEKVDAILREMLETFQNRDRKAQSSNARHPRRLKTIDDYILDALRENPQLSERGLWQQIENDSENVSDERIGEIEHDGVWIIDPLPEGQNKSQRLTRSSLRSRLSRLKIKFKSSH